MESRLTESMGAMLSEALVASSEATLELGKEALLTKATTELLRIVAGAGFAFASQLVIACLKLIIERKDNLGRDVQRILRNPLLTGIDRLQIAMSLETEGETLVAQQYRISRYQDALRSFDEALHNSEDSQKISIQLLRGLASLRIPGGQREAVAHLQSFREYCEEAETSLAAKARHEDMKANEAAQRASRVVVPVTWGISGRSFAGAEVSSLRLEKAQYEAEARAHRKVANEYRSKTEQWQLAKTTILLLQNQADEQYSIRS